MNLKWICTFVLAVMWFGGCGPALTDEGEVRDVSAPSCSPDGTNIVFVTNALNNGSMNDIWRVTVTGGQLAQLTSTPTVDENEPVYSPDGTRIAYSKRTADDESVWVMDANGSNALRINREHRDASSPAWMSDNQRLVVDTSGDLMLTNLSQAEIKFLAASQDYQGYPHCSSDDSMLVYERRPVSCSVCSSEGKICSQIWQRNIATMGAEVQLTTGHYRDSRPRISPDNQKIVFESNRDFANGHASSVYIINVDGTGLTRVNIQGNAYDPSWTSNGRIVFVLGETDPNAGDQLLNVVLINQDGAGLTRVTQTVAGPSMMPNGGAFSSFPQTVTLACSTSGAVIHYTTDGSAPTESSATYTSPISLSGPGVVRAKAWKAGYLPSPVTGEEFEQAP